MDSTSRSSQSSEADNDLNIESHSQKKTIDKSVEAAQTGCPSISKNT